MLTALWAATVADESFSAVLVLSLAGLDGSLWLTSQPFFAQLGEVFARAM
jgi:hypothetical protein